MLRFLWQWTDGSEELVGRQRHSQRMQRKRIRDEKIKKDDEDIMEIIQMALKVIE